jgi:hypothetical protein
VPQLLCGYRVCSIYPAGPYAGDVFWQCRKILTHCLRNAQLPRALHHELLIDINYLFRIHASRQIWDIKFMRHIGWRSVVSFIRRGRAVAQAVNRWFPTAACRVRVRAACGVYGGQSGTWADFLRVLRFPLPIIPPISPSS